MNQADEIINKDMLDLELIDVDSLHFPDEQTWLYKVPQDSGEKVDIIDWNLSCEWPDAGDAEYLKTETKLFELLDNILKNEAVSTPDKHKFDSRTFVRPKRRIQRPSLAHVVEAAEQSPNKYLTYNKYSDPPILRLKTFNVDTNTDNSAVVREYAMKRRSLLQDEDEDIQLEDMDATLVSDASGRLSGVSGVSGASGRLSDQPPSKPIQIDLSQPAHNLHNTFNKGMSQYLSMGMFRSGESLLRMSPPSLVSSVQLEDSGAFHDVPAAPAAPAAAGQGRPDDPNHRETGMPAGRESLDPMVTSMTLSILDDKDMSTSFLSQSTYPEHDSLLDSLPPSLVSSVNSSFVRPRTDSQPETNIFSSATFTHLEQSERLLSARPRHQMYSSLTKRDSLRDSLRGSESYTKCKDEDKDHDETITLHYSNNKFRRSKDSEKENLNSTFEKDDAFYKDMGVTKAIDLGRNSLNVTLDKQELNEIIQARQKLSLARKALPTESERSLPNQVDHNSPSRMNQVSNQTITVSPRENAAELLSRRRAMNGSNGCYDREEAPRRAPERNATFKKSSPSPRASAAMDATVVFVKDDDNVIDINSATMCLLDSDRTLRQEEWCGAAMVGSSESTDTATFSSSSPPDTAPDHDDPGCGVASTPLAALRRGARGALLQQLHHNISPIYDTHEPPPAPLAPPAPPAAVNSATIVRKHATAKRDLMSAKTSLEKRLLGPAKAPQRVQPNSIAPSASLPGVAGAAGGARPRGSGLPTSKLRQYSSHKELSRIPGSNPPPPLRSSLNPRGAAAGVAGAGGMTRRNVYASNPALSPTAPHPAHHLATSPAHLAPPIRRDSYTVTKDDSEPEVKMPPPPPPTLQRQGTETLRRAPPAQHQPAPPPSNMPPPNRWAAAPAQRLSQLPRAPAEYGAGAGAAAAAARRPCSVPAYKQIPPAAAAAAAEARPASGLPRPSRLPAPAPRRALRPPSVYSVAPAGDVDHY